MVTHKIIVILFLVFSLSAIGRTKDDTRPFYMGFTPFPYDIRLEAVDYTYAHIADEADLIAHHFDNGVPWVEALGGEPYSDNVMSDWAFRRSRTQSDQKVLVSVTPIRADRAGLALYRGETDDMPLPAPFDIYSFDHPDVEKAFLRYCDDIIAYFEPDYFLFGIEVNLLMKLNPAAWDSYMMLHRRVYAHLKETYPDLPVMMSMTAVDLLEGYTEADHEAQMQALRDVIGYTDLLGLSVYPYMAHFMTNSLPDDLFDQLASLTDKPIAITETGYPAQNFAVESGLGRLQFVSDETKQNAYMKLLLEKASEHQFRFVVQFVLRDYDALWKAIGGKEDLTIVWRDTGLYDEEGAERIALETWRIWLERPVNVSPDS